MPDPGHAQRPDPCYFFTEREEALNVVVQYRSEGMISKDASRSLTGLVYDDEEDNELDEGDQGDEVGRGQGEDVDAAVRRGAGEMCG